MLNILAAMIRFFGMNLPTQSMRIAMYRKAGIHIGKVAEFGGNIWLSINFRNLITVEDDVTLAGYTTILSTSFLFRNDARPDKYGYEQDGFFPVIIKKGAKIGMHVVILPGVTIGENSVIGACAVVTNNIPPNCVAVGSPAKPIRYLDSAEAISDNGGVEDRKMLSSHQMLYAKCKTCGIEFPSMIQCDKQIFRTLDLRDNGHSCPVCKHKNRYYKKDYYFRD